MLDETVVEEEKGGRSLPWKMKKKKKKKKRAKDEGYRSTVVKSFVKVLCKRWGGCGERVSLNV